MKNKKDEILNAAQEMIQTKGYNGFSYADISQRVGIRKASIHHYFPKKEDMAVAVIQRYRETFNLLLSDINKKEKNWVAKVSQYGKLYEAVLHENKLCLCGMLASDVETLPEAIKKEINFFFKDNVKWLSDILKTQKKFSQEELSMRSWQIISSLQGAVIMARMSSDMDIFFSTYEGLLIQLEESK